MIKYIIFSIISFMLGLFTREIIEFMERRNKTKDKIIKPLSEQDFKKAMKKLDIK